MITAIQRVQRAAVRVDGEVVGQIDRGLLLFVGVEDGDSAVDADETARKAVNLRVFPKDKPTDLSVRDAGGGCLVVSQFTLAADGRKGRRPSFDRAAPPEVAEPLYRRFCEILEGEGLPVETGVFGASMEVDLVNDGPVTFVLDDPH